MELQEPTMDQKLNMMVGIYQQKLANEQLSNTQLTVDNQILMEQNQILRAQLSQYNDVDVNQEDGEADSPAQPVGPQPGDEVKYADEPVKYEEDDDPTERADEEWTDISKVEEVAGKHTS